jgi:hypothetical protein
VFGHYVINGQGGTAVTVTTQAPLTLVVESGLVFSDGTVFFSQTGLYLITFGFSAAGPTSAGPVSFQLVVGGLPVPTYYQLASQNFFSSSDDANMTSISCLLHVNSGAVMALKNTSASAATLMNSAPVGQTSPVLYMTIVLIDING